ncbi:LPS O-antigen chain length determinant protein WzzB [Legionella tucsonensis]|nr:Wzz/FepE/Etk N-terminal domain-containing protein [Legionella tucsonensis]
MNHEIDLLTLARSLWKQKWLILFVTLISFLAGVTYLYFAKPVYEVNARISAPYTMDIEALNYGASFPEQLIKPFEVITVYNIFSSALLAESTHYKFFNKIYLPSLSVSPKDKVQEGVLYDQFKRTITIKEVPKSDPKQYIIKARGHEASKLSGWLSQYINMAKSDAKKGIINMISHRQQNILKELQQRIDSARETARERTSDRLVRVKEALKIAQAAGLSSHLPILVGNVTDDMEKPDLMYGRGSKALLAEIDNLNNRESETAFFPELRKAITYYDMYKNIKINPKDFRMFRLDAHLEEPTSAVSPRKDLILGFSIIIGLMGGIFIGMIRELFLRIR